MDRQQSIALSERPKFNVKPVAMHWALRYGLAIALVAATIGLSLLLTRLGIKINLTIPVVLALVAGAWYGGRGPGLLIGVLFQLTTIIYANPLPDTTFPAQIFFYFSTFSLYVFLALLISGLRSVMHRLGEQRDLLEITLSSIGDGVIATNTSGIVTFMNPVAEQLTGWGEAPARGVPIEDVFCIRNEATGEPVRNPVAKVLATGADEPLRNHTILKSRTGIDTPIEDCASPIMHGGEIKGAVLVFSDVTERKEAGAVAARLASIVESSSDAVISKDLNGIITSWNQGAEQIFGYAADETIGNPVTMLMPAERINEEPGILERIRRGEVIDHYETVRQHKDGRLLDISLNVSPVYDPQGRIIGASKIARDMTQRKRAESAIRERETMRRIVEAQEAERHRIARDLHDHLGQRMTALRLQIESLAGQTDDCDAMATGLKEVQEFASDVDRDIGFLSWELKPTELEELGLADAMKSFVGEWSRKYNVPAEFHASRSETGEPPRLGHIIETNLYRILQEALNNVLKHANAQNVSILLQHRSDSLSLIVEDDGSGFENAGTTGDLTRSGGPGIVGMRERAALLKGTLSIDTEPGVGTTVLVQIPLEK